MCTARGHVCFGPIADIATHSIDSASVLTAATGSHYHIRVDNINRLSASKSNNLVEDVTKLRLKFLVGHIADVWRRNDLFKLQQRQIHFAHWLILKYVDSGKARAASIKCSY
jgi:hypothetical protein